MTALALALAGCAGSGAGTTATSTPDGPSTTAVASASSTAGSSASAASEAATALDGLLRARDAALAVDDAPAFQATLADPASPPGRRQVQAFAAARALGAVRVSHDVSPPADDPAAVDVTIRYRVRGIDRADRSATVRYALARTGGRWLVAAEGPTGTDAAPPWLAMPALTVRRGAHGVVAGTAGRAALAAAVATVDRSLPALATVWSGAPVSTLVLVPGTSEEADALRGSTGPAVGDVAATTDGPVDSRGLATGDRVVLDPDARRRLTAVGRDVVLTHELAHVAVRATVPGSAPLWLAEGYADHVGYARAGLPEPALAAPLVAAVRAGDAPRALPGDGDLDPAVTDIEVGYLASWQAAQTVVDLVGEDGLRRLVRACTVTGGPDVAETACDASLPTVLGLDRAAFTRRWQQRLSALAR